MIAHLRAPPPPAFVDAIKKHFLLKRNYVMDAVLASWIKEAETR